MLYQIFTTETALAFIVAYKQAHDGNSPAIRDICREFAKSTSVVDAMLDRLASRGLIERDENGTARGIRVPGGEWRMTEVGRRNPKAENR